MRPHKKLRLWGLVIDFIADIYKLTKNFPNDEKYVLVPQLRRAAISIASNIAEGAGRTGKQEKIHFFVIARGSLSEVDAQLEIAMKLNILNNNVYKNTEMKMEEISRMLQGLIKSCEKYKQAD